VPQDRDDPFEALGPLGGLLRGLADGLGLDDDERRDGSGPLGDLFGQGQEYRGSHRRDEEPKESGAGRAARAARTRTLDRFGHDLTAAARAGRLDPVVGRDVEIDQVVEVLARRTKNNPVLVGEPGVGKTAIVEGLAQRIVAGEVPVALRDVRVVVLDLAGMVAGTQYRGQFEERLTAVVDEIVAAGRSLVVFVDEIHLIVGAGTAKDQAMDAAAIFKPALARGELQLVGATTPEDHRRHLERDAALDRRFEVVRVGEPTPEATLGILRGLRARYEEHHRVRITDAALDAAVALSVRYLRDRYLPDKAVDLVDRAAARVGLRGAPTSNSRVDELVRAREVAADAGDDERVALLDRELERLVLDTGGSAEIGAREIAEVVADRSGIPVTELTRSERARLLDLESLLHKRIVGQRAAVEAVSDAVRSARAGLSGPDRPAGSFLFLGPTGVGKTELARALAGVLFGSADHLVRLDMTEYADRASVTRLVGAPPGYVGHEDAGQLTEPVRRNPYSVVLLDEIEKAHPEVLAVLLQVLDAGRLTDARGCTVDFRHTLVVMTGNVGLQTLALRPEFLNRIDDVVTFDPLSPSEIREIAGMMVGELVARVAAQGITLEVEPGALDRLAELGYSAELGARPLRRVVAREVERKLARRLLAGEVRGRVRLTADLSLE
jgi:ATP-dependent Clp protease ATP-binding subunit ClpC